MNREKVLVIGGAGFLGSHISDALTDADYDVTIFDQKMSPHLKDNQSQIIGDILDEKKLDEATRNVDYVYHLAGMADIDECAEKPLDAIKNNILGTTYILEACVKNQVKKVLFSSSAYVYSDTGSFYRISKQASELIIEGYQEKFNLDYVILRFGSLYGERADRRNSIHRLIEDALKEEKIVYHGQGNEKREFIHIRDAADLSVKALDPKYSNQNLLLTGNSSIEYLDLLNMIREILHNKVSIILEESKSKTHYKLSPYSFNPKIARKLVNNPHIDLGQGLLNLIGEVHKNIHDELRENEGFLVEKNGKGVSNNNS
ncbi:MAG: NAD(P)-dependent oxidoreductase [Firmicutes bacterium]|nr:NAD(P)-dependent oxidoreductase [Bacillota bacterium]